MRILVFGFSGAIAFKHFYYFLLWRKHLEQDGIHLFSCLISSHSHRLAIVLHHVFYVCFVGIFTEYHTNGVLFALTAIIIVEDTQIGRQLC